MDYPASYQPPSQRADEAGASCPEAVQQGNEAMSRPSACHTNSPAALLRRTPVDSPSCPVS